MKYFSLVLALFLVVSTMLKSQINEWKITDVKKCQSIYSSKDGSKIAYLTKEQDSFKISCVNALDGNKMWEKRLNFDLEGLEKYFDFYGDAFYIGNGKFHEFLKASTGETLKKIPLLFEEWDDIVLEKNPNENFEIAPIVDSNLIIYFGKAGFQAIDLKSQNEIYSTKTNSKEIALYKQKEYLILKVNEDSVYIFDSFKNKLLFKESYKHLDLNSRYNINIVVFKDKGIFYCDEDVKLYDFKENKSFKVIGDPLDYDFSSPLISDTALLFCISNDGVQTIYDVGYQNKIIETKKDSLPGFIENVIIANDRKNAILFVYDNNENTTTVCNIGILSNTVKWKKSIFEYARKYEVNNVSPSIASTMLSSFGKSLLFGSVINKNKSYFNRRRGFVDFYVRPDKAKYGLSNDLALNKAYKGNQKCLGYARALDVDDKKLNLLCVGEIKELIDNKKEESEFYLSLDLNNGNILEYKKLTVIPECINDNAINDNLFKVNNDGQVILGEKNIYYYSNSKIVDVKISDEKFSYLGIKNDYLFFSTFNLKSDFYNFWRIKLNKDKLDKKLVASTYEIAYLDYSNFADFNNTLYLTEDSLSLLPLQSEALNQKQIPNPIWSKKSKELKYDYFATFEQDSNSFFQGLSCYNNNIVVSSKSYISAIKTDGSCSWSHEWKIDPENVEAPIKTIGNSITAVSNGYAIVLKFDCKQPVIYYDKIDEFPKNFRIDNSSKGFIQLDEDENFIQYKRLAD